MKYFTKIAEGVDVAPLLAQIKENEELFRAIRPDILPWQPGYEHRELWAIPLRMTPFRADVFEDEQSCKEAQDELIAFDTDNFRHFSEARPFVYSLLDYIQGGHVGRCAIAKLNPGKKVYGHYDKGLSAEFYTRFQIVLEGGKDNWIHCGIKDGEQEHVEMMPGEIWTFSHRDWHYFTNRSDKPRTYLNIDIR